jgi:hypothetical protein
VCRLPASTVASCGQALPCICRRWLPTWLSRSRYLHQCSNDRTQCRNSLWGPGSEGAIGALDELIRAVEHAVSRPVITRLPTGRGG